MGLQNILAQIQADLVASLSPPLDAVVFRYGARELPTNDAPPRIVWVRARGSYVPAQQGVRAIGTSRILRTHVTAVEAHIWAPSGPASTADDTYCETLAHALVASVYRCAHGAFDIVGDDWPNPDWATFGFVAIVGFTFQIPVTDTAVTSTSVTVPANMQFDQSTAPPPTGTLQAPGDS